MSYFTSNYRCGGLNITVTVADPPERNDLGQATASITCTSAHAHWENEAFVIQRSHKLDSAGKLSAIAARDVARFSTHWVENFEKPINPPKNGGWATLEQQAHFLKDRGFDRSKLDGATILCDENWEPIVIAAPEPPAADVTPVAVKPRKPRAKKVAVGTSAEEVLAAIAANTMAEPAPSVH